MKLCTAEPSLLEDYKSIFTIQCVSCASQWWSQRRYGWHCVRRNADAGGRQHCPVHMGGIRLQWLQWTGAARKCCLFWDGSVYQTDGRGRCQGHCLPTAPRFGGNFLPLVFRNVVIISLLFVLRIRVRPVMVWRTNAETITQNCFKLSKAHQVGIWNTCCQIVH